MVVVKNYSENYLSNGSNYEREPEINEERAYVVGIWVSAVIAAILLLLLVFITVARSRNNEQIVQKETPQEVLGEKKVTKPTESKKTAEVKTETQTTNESANVSNLERPLSEAETLEKAKTIPGSKIHTVASGESLYTIGAKYDADWKEIAEVNNLAEPYSLHTGQKLIIP